MSTGIANYKACFTSKVKLVLPDNPVPESP
jgi:hypothetical protein